MSGEHEYQLLERIGIGGMAEVYRANMLGAEGFERPIAIKRILPNLAEDDDFVKMFIDEAKIAVQLSHPNIVGIFDLGRLGDDYFIAMELVHGRDLRQIQDREAQLGRRMPIEIAVHAAMKVCEALHHAHFKGGGGMMDDRVFIIHRDVSPQNVLVSYDGQVKVTDFGLAKAAGRAVQTQAGIIKGKLAYMSPEQLTTTPIDQRSDVFAAGTLLWEMLTGERLFLGKNDRETIQNVFEANVQSTRALDPQIPIELDRVVMKALAKDRDQRYRTAQELHDDLEEASYAIGAMINAPGVSAYMRALFPEAEVSGAGRRRDPRAATAEIRLEDARRPVAYADEEELDSGELQDDDDLREEELSDDEIQPAPESIAPEALDDDEAFDEPPDPEESRKTIPPLDMLDVVTPMTPEAMLPMPAATQHDAVEARTAPREPASALRSNAATAPPPGKAAAKAGAPGSGARAVQPLAPPPMVAPPYQPFGAEDEFSDRTMFSDPAAFAAQDYATSELAQATAEYQGELNERLLAMKLEPLSDTGDARLAPEEMLSTKHHAPSSDLLAKARREREPVRPMPPVKEVAPPPDTVPPPRAHASNADGFDDSTMVGSVGTFDPFRNEWEDETTPVGGERPRTKRG